MSSDEWDVRTQKIENTGEFNEPDVGGWVGGWVWCNDLGHCFLDLLFS
jgi:hypothetical protein